MTTYLQERLDGDVRLEDREATTAPAVSVPPRTGRIDSTGYFYGTAARLVQTRRVRLGSRRSIASV